ncbi:MAG TPA: hypothetical protein VME24_02370 [Alphaproteobacteria bacterium]|nr:hypothetical protein [Alphaproteobacteria bacterium]
MDIKSVITSAMVSIAGFFGCSKAAPPAAKTTAPVAESSVKDLGVLQMTNNYETCVSVGAGNDCRMVPKILGRRDLQITVTFESKKPDGTTTGFSVLQLQGTTTKPFEVSVGSTDFTFTPQVAEE